MGLFDKLFGAKVPPSASAAPISTINLDKPSRLNLMKERAEVVKTLSLEKGLTENYRVALNLDFSGSMGQLYSSGQVQELYERLFPVAMQFDDNQAIDLFAFHDYSFDLGEVKIDGFADAIKSRVENKLSYGGTNYAPSIKEITNKYKTPGAPAFVIFITDGECGDPGDSKKALISAAHYGVFFQFVGIGNASMRFLEEMDTMSGRKVDNANFFRVKNIKSITDAELYSSLMSEFPDWLKNAKRLGII